MTKEEILRVLTRIITMSFRDDETQALDDICVLVMETWAKIQDKGIDNGK